MKIKTQKQTILGHKMNCTGILSHLGAKLRNLADRQAGAGCYSLATLSSNDSKNEDPVWCLSVSDIEYIAPL